MSFAPLSPRSDYFLAKICGFAILIIFVATTIAGVINSHKKMVLKAIHLNQRKEEATIVLERSKGVITVPATSSSPPRSLDVRTEESVYDVILNTFVSPLFPILGHHTITIIIENTAIKFIHAGGFFVCEDCHTRDLPRTWALVDDDVL